MIELMPVSTRRRIAIIVLAALTLCAFAAGCGSAGSATHTDVAQTPSTARASASAAQVTERFGLALMHRLPAGNLAFSPDSVAASLAMVGTGAVGQTATQIARALGLSSPRSFASLGELQRQILAEQSPAAHDKPEAPTLDIANGLFVQQDYPLQASFTSGLEQAFGAVPESVDFLGTSGTEAINEWVAQQTHGLIPQIVAQLSPETRLALANAIYLKAHWSEHFKPDDSEPAPFHGTVGATSTIFMHKTEALSYGRGRGYSAVALPLARSSLSVLILLPSGQTLTRLETSLNASTLNRIVRGLSKRNVHVSLPRFHLHTQAVLNGALQALGITQAFGEEADLSGMTGGRQLKLGEVAHAADFKVDEEGVVAAAATVATAEAMMAEGYSHVVDFNANHPFMFFLRDDRSGALLFAGRLVKPEN
jgi:serpin B